MMEEKHNCVPMINAQRTRARAEKHNPKETRFW